MSIPKLFPHPVLSVIRTAVVLMAIFLAKPTDLQAQGHDIGIMLGGSFYMGPANETLFASTGPAAGVFYRRNFTDRLSIRANTLVAGLDTWILGGDSALANNILETNIQAEINFLPFESGNPDYPFTFFIFGGGGMGVFSFTNNNGNPDIAFPPLASFGAGFKFNPLPRFVVAAEWGMRHTFSTDLRIATPILNPNKKDWYSFAGITLSYTLKDPSGARCPN